MKKILKAKCVWHVVGGGDPANQFATHQDGTEQTSTAAEVVADDEYARDVARSVILRGLGKVSFVDVTAH